MIIRNSLILLSALLLIPLKANALSITNSTDQSDLVNYNKIYIPDDYINQNWNYTYNNDDITIYTNQNCYTQYSTQYCDCYTYSLKNNIITNSYTCNVSSNQNRVIPFNSITDDVKFSNRLFDYYIKDKLILIGSVILGIIFALFLTKERSSL